MQRIRYRLVARIGLLGAILSIGALAGFSAASAGGNSIESPSFVAPAAPGEATYLVTNPDLTQFSTPIEKKNGDVGVGFDAAWSTPTYPGIAPCIATVVDAAGETIGTQQFSIGSATPVGQHIVVGVSLEGKEDAATSSTVQCDEATRPSDDAGYVISAPTISGDKSDLRLNFDVSWKTDEPPLLQSCEAKFQLEDGSVVTHSFNIGLAEGPSQGNVSLPNEFNGAKPQEVACQPYLSPA